MRETCDHVIDVIRAAGEMLMERKARAFTVGMKHENPKDIVTEVDTEVSDFITEKIQDAYPEHAIYSEEAEDIEGSEYLWTIDPIDGTANFSRGIPHFGISIGLLHHGEPVCGAVLDPVTGELFHFTKGTGAFLGDTPIEVSSEQELARSYILLAAGRKPELRNWGGESFRRLLGAANKTKNLGSSALDLCYLAAGRIEGAVFGTLSTMDIAAAVGIVREAGGVLADENGEELLFSRDPARVYTANNAGMLEEIRTLLEAYESD